MQSHVATTAPCCLAMMILRGHGQCGNHPRSAASKPQVVPNEAYRTNGQSEDWVQQLSLFNICHLPSFAPRKKTKKRKIGNKPFSCNSVSFCLVQQPPKRILSQAIGWETCGPLSGWKDPPPPPLHVKGGRFFCKHSLTLAVGRRNTTHTRHAHRKSCPNCLSLSIFWRAFPTSNSAVPGGTFMHTGNGQLAFLVWGSFCVCFLPKAVHDHLTWSQWSQGPFG